MNKFLGRPDLKPTHPSETKPGLNKIVMTTAHFGNQEVIMEKDVPIKMRDGVTIYVNVFRPNKPGKFPVVMSMDPYNKDGLPPYETFRQVWPTVGTIVTSLYAPFESPDPGFWVPNDYILIKIATRGSSNSDGDLYPWTKTETQDYYEVIEWAGVQEWSDGNVGLNGVSYLAMTQWRVAAMNPPHLKAIIPWEGTSDLYREWYFHGGIPETVFSADFEKLQHTRWPNNNIEAMVAEQKAHPLLDEHWEEREVKLSDIKVPMFVCASWSTQGLHNRGTFEGFKQSSSKDKWLLVHGRKEWETYYLRESLEQQKEFFDYFLKGMENDWMDTPRVRYEVREKFYNGHIRTANEWPIPQTVYSEYYLNGEEMSLQQAPVQNEATLTYNAEPGQTANSDLRFTFTANKDMELTGNMKLKLWVSTDDTDDMDLFVGIKKFDRRGNEVFLPDFNHLENGQVASGWLRVSHRELDPVKSTPYQPVLKHKRLLKLTKGEIVPVEIEILPSSVFLKSGESVVLVIKGSDIIIDDNPTGSRGYGHTDTVNQGAHSIHVGGKYDSFLLVPVIPSKE
ncbi:CocE/NonD family hydrolase [Paenibacillus taichungensis]|uniref:CocE/NonD family hydrolase n=1 Tax=Paenibacillus taichungensis TaxID=484184 RepID=UPI002DB5F751|nr:CocE/NonD family hydrolase [Paenibacillus taichungensis]MEC0111202.1 CocE/NonD family hydrolase [Paenibacillus taichungensis]MEC0200864.1 CocE/NonD family hydrolase [Paenibacillus taichungensis]